MKKLGDLLAELCPNGVEYKALENVSEIKRGIRVVKSQLNQNEKYPVYQNSLTPLGFFEKTNAPANTTFIIVAGAAGEIGYSTCDFWAADDCFYFLPSAKLLGRYIYHFLLMKQEYLRSKVRKASIPRLSRSAIEKLEIPVPPLEIQQEIVRILDQFTGLTAELTTQLAAELTARKKQYEYYREKLLTFGHDIPMIKLKDIAEIKGRIGFRGYTSKDMVEKGDGAISLSPGNIQNGTLLYEDNTYISWDKYYESPEIMVQKDDVLLCKTGSTLGKVAIVDFLPEKATINPQLVVLKNIKCDNRYLKYYMTTYGFQSEIQQKKGLGSVPNISQSAIGNINIPLPSRDIQNKIVSILDRFDTLCNDLTSGLPAEIEDRRKQYEYYRDKLLTFKELEV